MEIIEAIQAEVERAEKLHPYWPEDIIHATAIMNEEAGEAIRAALNAVYQGGSIEDLRTEVVQTAATCIRILKNLQ